MCQNNRLYFCKCDSFFLSFASCEGTCAIELKTVGAVWIKSKVDVSELMWDCFASISLLHEDMLGQSNTVLSCLLIIAVISIPQYLTNKGEAQHFTFLSFYYIVGLIRFQISLLSQLLKKQFYKESPFTFSSFSDLYPRFWAVSSGHV